MSIDSTLRKAAKLAKAGNRAGAAALYREVLAKFPGNATAKKGLAALAGPAPMPGTGPRPGAMPGGALGAGLIPGARPVAPPAGLQGGAAPAPRKQPAAKPAAAPRAKATGRTPLGGPTPSLQQMQALERLMARGDFRSAAAEGQRLAMLFPRAPGLLNMLAQAQARLGQNDAALAGYDRVLAIDPGFAGAHVNKASIYALTGRYDEAETEARAALAIDPKSPQALMLLGYALVNTNRPEEAVEPFETAVKLAPRMTQSQLGLGNVYAALNNPEKALVAFEAAFDIEPENGDVLNNLANTLVALKRFDEGVEKFEAAAKRDPRNTVLLTNHARALRELARGAEAIDICRRVLKIDENKVDTWNLLGSCLREVGDKAGAIEAVERVSKLEPDNIPARALRWHIETLPLDHEDYPVLAETVADESAPLPMRSNLALALFRAHDKVGEAETAMSYLVKAKEFRVKDDPYDLDANEAVLRELMDVFRAGVTPLGPDDMAAVPAPARPVFIVGMPRSGTSLVEQIVASHSQVHGAGELNTLGTLLKRFGWYPGDTRRAFDRETLLELRRDYFDNIVRIGVDKPVVTDKTPLNFRHVGPALAAMPEARVLFMRRDARATCWSNFSRIFMGRANNFGNDMVDTARMYRLHLEFFDLWRELYPDQVTMVPYERLTEHQEEESRKLVAAAGLDWEDACLDFHKSKRAVRTASLEQVRQKMYTGSSEAWRAYEPWLGPMLDALDGIDADRD